MRLTSILPKEAIKDQLKAENSEEVLQELSDLIHETEPSLSKEEIFLVLQEREKLGSTGINCGIAIPHNKLSSAKKMIACFGRSSQGIDFQSQDGELTHLFFAIIAPENAAGMHLKILAKLSKLLKEEPFRESLKNAKNANEIYAILSSADEKDL